MNQWKISRTCKCNNFAINRTRIMSGNCYVPVTHTACQSTTIGTLLLFPECSTLTTHKINTFATNHAIQLYAGIFYVIKLIPTTCLCVRCRAMEFQKLEVCSLLLPFLSCARVYFAISLESNWNSISFG